MVRGKSFKIRCFDLIIEIFYKFESTKNHCLKYLAEDEAVADLSVCPDNKDYEMVRSYLENKTDEETELTVISYLLSDAVIEKGSAVMHGAAISYDGEGVIFTAESGTGKTTHIKLWKKVFNDKVSAINGDKPIVSVRDRVYVSGSPFCGKEGYSENKTVPLKAICFIERGEENDIKKLSKSEALSRVFNQLFVPKVGSELMSKALGITDGIVKNVEFYLLKCNMTEDAPKVAHSMIFGKTED